MKKLLTYACAASFVAIGITGCGDPPKAPVKPADKKVDPPKDPVKDPVKDPAPVAK